MNIEPEHMEQINNHVVENVGFFDDAHNWVAISTVIFAIVLYKFAKEPFFNLLDGRTKKIRNELDEAERLRVEAQELLARYQHQQQDAVKESEQIIIEAKKEALNMKSDAEKELQADIIRKQKQLDERLQRMEQDAITKVRNQIIEISMQATENAIKEAISKKKSTANDLTDSSIDVLSKNIHKTA